MINKNVLVSARTNKLRGNNKIRGLFSSINLKGILVFIMSFFIARSSIMDNITPFGIAFFAAYIAKKINEGLLVGISVSLGILSIKGYEAFPYIIIVWSLYLLYKIIYHKLKITTLKMSLFTSILMVLIKSFYILITDYYLYDILMTIFEGVIIFTLIYIFSYGISAIENEISRGCTNEEMICTAIMISVCISGLNNLSLIGLSIKEIISIFIVIMTAYIKGPSFGATIGVTIGTISGMSYSTMPVLISVYGFSGMLAGLFKDLGKLGTCLGFILGSGIMTFYINGITINLIGFKEIIVVCILMLIFTRPIDNVKNIILEGFWGFERNKKSYSEKLKEMTFKRLKEISKVFDELGQTFYMASEKKHIIEQNDISGFVNEVVNDVCSNCAMHKVCWVDDFYATYHSMFNIMSFIEANGSITENALPDILKKRCIKPDLIVNKCNYLFDMYKINYEWENKILESRQLVSEQLGGVSKIIDDLSKEIYKDVRFKEDVEKQIYAGLRKEGINVAEIIVAESDDDEFQIYIEIKPSKNNVDLESITNMVSEIVGYELIKDDFNYKTKGDEGIKIKLIRANRYGAITKVASLNDSFNYVSGDNYTYGEKCSNYYIALSDGMGMGIKASNESNITISLLEKFLEAGFNKELALKTINSILVLKSNEEMLSTVDISILNLLSGRGQFIKVGAVSTFIKRKDSIEIINSNSLPVGILKDVDFQVYESDLEDGDFIIMMSDGVLDADIDKDDKEAWMSEIIEGINTINPQKMAEEILRKALERCNNNARDDMTVLVTKIWKRR